MVKTEQQYFEEGLSIQQYMNDMSTLKAESFSIYERFTLPADGFSTELEKHQLQFLVITEDWCGDAMVINPIIRKIAEESNHEMKVVSRDKDTDLIDRHLTNNGRAIPIVLILNTQGELIGRWGPRAPEVQAMVDGIREGNLSEEEQREAIMDLRKRYTKDEKIWFYIYNSFKEALLNIIKLEKG
nr:thioredoxin family protein [Niallia taxi]